MGQSGYNVGMSQELMTRREGIIFQITSLLFMAVAAAVGFTQTRSVPTLAAMLALLLVMAVLQVFLPDENSARWRIHAYLGVQGALVASLMLLIPGWTMFPTLFCVFSVQAILLLSINPGIYWVATYVVLTALLFGYSFNLQEGLIGALIYGGINAFFGSYASALLRANAARRESQVLLEDLQEAHGQLQEYALRVEEMAVLEERNRLAREMHDTLGHRLTVASVQLEAAQRLCPTDAERAAGLVGTVREQVREALAELRITVATLRTPVQEDLQLRSSLRRLMDQFEEVTGLTVNRVLPEELPPLPNAHRQALYRAAQEALTNVQKHARARQVWLVLAVGDGAVSLLVSDDGRGLAAGSGGDGFGLQGLRERAEQLEGELHLEPRQGGGTQLSFRLPLPPQAPGS
jgi:signal transduction histidine kinase